MAFLQNPDTKYFPGKSLQIIIVANVSFLISGTRCCVTASDTASNTRVETRGLTSCFLCCCCHWKSRGVCSEWVCVCVCNLSHSNVDVNLSHSEFSLTPVRHRNRLHQHLRLNSCPHCTHRYEQLLDSRCVCNNVRGFSYLI